MKSRNFDLGPTYVIPGHSVSSTSDSIVLAKYHFQKSGVLRSWKVTHAKTFYHPTNLYENRYYLYYNQTGDDSGVDRYKSGIKLRSTHNSSTLPTLGYSSPETTISPNITISSGDFIVIAYNSGYTYAVSNWEDLWIKITFTFESV